MLAFDTLKGESEAAIREKEAAIREKEAAIREKEVERQEKEAEKEKNKVLEREKKAQRKGGRRFVAQTSLYFANELTQLGV